MRLGLCMECIRRLALGGFLSMVSMSVALTQYEGEWTGRGWRGPSSGDGGLFWLIVVVAVIGGIIYLVNEGFPNFFSAMGGLLIIFVAAQIITGILVGLGAGLHQDHAIWIFLILLVLLYVKSYSDRGKKRK